MSHWAHGSDCRKRSIDQCVGAWSNECTLIECWSCKYSPYVFRLEMSSVGPIPEMSEAEEYGRIRVNQVKKCRTFMNSIECGRFGMIKHCELLLSIEISCGRCTRWPTPSYLQRINESLMHPAAPITVPIHFSWPEAIWFSVCFSIEMRSEFVIYHAEVAAAGSHWFTACLH